MPGRNVACVPIRSLPCSMFSAKLDRMVDDLRTQHDFWWSMGAASAATTTMSAGDRERRMLVVPPRLRPYLKEALQEYAQHEAVFHSLQEAEPFPQPPPLMTPVVSLLGGQGRMSVSFVGGGNTPGGLLGGPSTVS